MDLFVINRYDENNITEISPNEEEERLKKLLNKIEKNKAKRSKQREKKKEKVEPLEKYETKENIGIKKENIEDKSEEQQNEPIAKETKKEEKQVGTGFTILEDKNFKKKNKVKRVLPKWLANPTVISVNLQELHTKVSELKELDKDLRKKLKANGVKYFFPVQAEVIPWLLKANKHADIVFPSDICVSAPTGSGKTLAFVLPVVQALKHHTVKKIRALIILPTQDLAVQVFKAFKYYTKDTNLDVSLITGISPFEMEQKQLIYENTAFGFISKVDILVCTAGRLVDHIKNTKGFCLNNLEFLVIDEADRVLETLQNDWLYHLEKHIHEEGGSSQTPKVLNLLTLRKQRPPQKLLFSATLSQDPEKLEKLRLFQPKLFTSVTEEENTIEFKNLNEGQLERFIGKYTTPKELTEKYIICSMDLKPLVLYEFIKVEKLTKTMVFTHSVETTHRLSILLKGLFKDKMKIREISSQLDGKQRNTLIEEFSKGEIDILVCTDALARGMDLLGVQCVISYSAPKFVKTYIHRAGRTARAGEQGLAVTLLHKSQQSKFQNLLQQAGKNNLEEIKISEDELEKLSEHYKEALGKLKSAIEKEEKIEFKKVKSAKRISKTKKQ